MLHLARVQGDAEENETRLDTHHDFTDDDLEVFMSELLTLDVFSSILTGGGACRYCVRKCPNNT